MAMPRASFRNGSPISAVILGCSGIVEVDDDQTAIAEYVRVDTGDGDATGAVQLSFWIER